MKNIEALIGKEGIKNTQRLEDIKRADQHTKFT